MYIIVPYNGKIVDITHPDTNKHTLDLAAALGETRKIIAVNVVPSRITSVELDDGTLITEPEILLALIKALIKKGVRTWKN
jgi:hypothetical protein